MTKHEAKKQLDQSLIEFQQRIAREIIRLREGSTHPSESKMHHQKERNKKVETSDMRA